MQPVPSIPLIRAAFSQPFRLTLNRIGCSWDADLNKLGMPVDYDVGPMALIPERPWHCLVDRIATREDIPDLGLRIGNEVPFGDILSWSHLFKGCSTLQEILSIFCLHSPNQSSTRSFDVVHRPTGVWLRDTGPSLTGNRQRDAQIRSYVLLGMIQVVQLALGKSWRPRLIELPFKRNRAIEQSSYLGAEDVFFERPFAAIEIPLEALSARTHLKPGSCRSNIEALEIQRHSKIPEEFIFSVQQVIFSCLTANDCHIDNIAMLCGVPVRTLQRSLSAKGVSYTELLEQTRREKSRNLVQRNELPLGEVAHKLGYSDYSKFSRAFQRWFRETPRQARLRYTALENSGRS